MDLIFNADDLGRSREVNHAVLLAHERGVLTSASLMATGQAFAEAVAIARDHPALAVGLHLVLSDGKSALPHRCVPSLVDREGRFRRSPARAGIAYFLHPRARRELAEEIRAQFERFAETGLRLSHVDGHQHLHVHPTVLDLVLPLARQHGASGIRIPHDPLRPALRFDPARWMQKTAWAAAFGTLGRRARRRVRPPMVSAAYTPGLMQSGHMTEAYVLGLLAILPPDTSAEIYFHPTAGARVEPLGPNPEDLAALMSPAVRERIAQPGFRLTTYPLLAATHGRITPPVAGNPVAGGLPV